MQEFFEEIEKMKINLFESNNNNIEVELVRNKDNNNILWKSQNSMVNLEIVTDSEMRSILSLKKSDNVLDEDDVIKQKFLDYLFEYKMNCLINSEDGFDDAEETEE